MTPSPFVAGCTKRKCVLIYLIGNEPLYLPVDSALKFAADIEKEAKRVRDSDQDSLPMEGLK